MTGGAQKIIVHAGQGLYLCRRSLPPKRPNLRKTEPMAMTKLRNGRLRNSRVFAAARLLPALMAAILGLTGCSSNPDTTALYAAALPVLRAKPALDPAFLAAQVRAQKTGERFLLTTLESNPAQLSIFLSQMRSEASGVTTWVGPGGEQIMTQNGMLVGTRGFGGDILAADVTDSEALIRSFGSGYVTRLMTVIDGENHATTRAFRCAIAPGETQPVNQGAIDVLTRTVTETCKSRGITFDNYYWVVPTSREIIQSSQWAGQTTQKISIRNTPQS